MEKREGRLPARIFHRRAVRMRKGRYGPAFGNAKKEIKQRGTDGRKKRERQIRKIETDRHGRWEKKKKEDRKV